MRQYRAVVSVKLDRDGRGWHCKLSCGHTTWRQAGTPPWEVFPKLPPKRLICKEPGCIKESRS